MYTVTGIGCVELQCEYQPSIQMINDALNEPSHSLVAVIGCGCSTSTEAVASRAELQEIPLVGSTSTTVLNFRDPYYRC